MEKFYKTFVDNFKDPATSILEIGSRDGDHAEQLRALANIEPHLVNIVEPHPESYRNIIKNYPEFRSFELAVSDNPGVLNFNAVPCIYNKHVMGTSSLLPPEKDKVHLYPPLNWIKVLAVTGRTILQLIDRWQIDLVKIDVEGFTYEVLKSFGPDIRLLRALHVEVEIEPLKIWEGQHQYSDVRDYLNLWGFREMYYLPMFWGGNQGDSVWLRND